MYVLMVIVLILCIASHGLSAEFHGFTCATGWNQLTLEQKQYFMGGLDEGIIAGIVSHCSRWLHRHRNKRVQVFLISPLIKLNLQRSDGSLANNTIGRTAGPRSLGAVGKLEG